MRTSYLGSLLSLSGLLLSSEAAAYTTRVHIALANDIHGALVASTDGRTVALAGSDAVVRLAEDDARSIRDWPEAFRAGAVGPDNFVFPGMTDLTHALGLSPYDQCEDLYGLAATDEERAYALGCFLHGASDAVVHHYVNFLTGETFTLNPISHARESSFSNAARHIVAESMVQDALLDADPEVFGEEAMRHTIPQDFALRAVVSPTSPAWTRMATHALPAWEVVDAADPDAFLVERVEALEVAPAEYLVLLPLMIDRAHIDLDLGVLAVEDTLARYQDPSTPIGGRLGVEPGPDGLLGTSDDDTDCWLTCPELYAEYFTLVAMLEPRADYGGTSATDEIVAELHGDLDGLLPAYVETVAAASQAINAPLAPGESSIDLVELDLESLTGPIEDWADDLVDIDWDLVARTAFPDWLLDLEDFLSSLGIAPFLNDLLASYFQPLIDETRDAVLDIALAEAEAVLADLIAELEASDSIEAEFLERLQAAAPADGPGTVLDDLPSSGLWMHSHNMVAVTLADHRMMLPTEPDWGGVGPASFDASYTLAWSQPALCDDIRPHVLPLGDDLRALLSLSVDGVQHWAEPGQDAPVECHAGELTAFTTTPDGVSCALTDLDTLMDSRTGSLSRAFPPEIAGAGAACLGIAIDGLPEPETETTGTDTTGTDTTGTGTTPGTSSETDPTKRAAPKSRASEPSGCGCQSSSSLPGMGWLVLVLLPLSARRSRH